MTQLIPLPQWNESTFGGRYTDNTLRGWARDGLISPPAIKVGRDWLVEQCAKYVKPKPQIKIPDNVDTTIETTDPVVLSILGKMQRNPNSSQSKKKLQHA